MMPIPIISQWRDQQNAIKRDWEQQAGAAWAGSSAANFGGRFVSKYQSQADVEQKSMDDFDRFLDFTVTLSLIHMQAD